MKKGKTEMGKGGNASKKVGGAMENDKGTAKKKNEQGCYGGMVAGVKRHLSVSPAAGAQQHAGAWRGESPYLVGVQANLQGTRR